ncbi:hypothetical protein BDP27DRAFT_1446617 [Rhodocollybia butyracea]|uniref:Uncharacterized protein n=1 Tax=Rhodocollybia butyracea TaxID=206335 RepID=A0A9P5UAJ2_9AGAR|nr:hypothetical protein BDP27DRAFT_1446617 [Rhodocollybia butyracea]
MDMLPRPKPPAQLRRASKESSKLTFPDDDDPDIPGLLNRADDLIRERQRELSFTSELSRELKQTHEALVARTPLTSPSYLHVPLPPMSPPAHRSISTFNNTSTPFQTLHALHSTQSPVYSNRPPKHARRVSITQSELGRLSDQNAELLLKLEQLEQESASADKYGRRKLGKLEREIQTLRTELDEARQDAIRRTKEEKSAARMKPRRKHTEDEETTPTFQDFAPSSSTRSTSSFATDATNDSASSESSTIILNHLLSKISELEEANVLICQEQLETAGRLQVAQSEVESIRKVWSYLGIGPGPDDDDDNSVDVEIVDDEEDLIGAEKQGTIRFRTLKQDASESAPFAIASQAENVFDSSTLSQVDSVQYLRSVDIAFAEGIYGGMHSTVRSPPTYSSQPFGRRSAKGKGKVRKSAVGLFREGENVHDASSDSLNLVASFSPFPVSRYTPHSSFSPSNELSELDFSALFESPGSFVSLDDEHSPQFERGFPDGLRRRSLGSEMGDFGDNDSLSRPRSRNNSLFQELESSFDSEVSGASLDSGENEDNDMDQSVFPRPARIHITPPTPDKRKTFSESSSDSSPTTIFTTPPSSTPGSSVNTSPASSPLVSKSDSARARRASLSQSVKARAGRWGPRLVTVIPRGDDPDSLTGFSIRKGLSGKIGEGFGSLFGSSIPSEHVDRYSNRPATLQTHSPTHSSALMSLSPGDSSSTESNFTARLSTKPSSSQGSSTPKLNSNVRVLVRSQLSSIDRARSLILEAWLWFQLLVVLSVFIWAVAKRGPRSVLKIDNESEDIQPETNLAAVKYNDEDQLET